MSHIPFYIIAALLSGITINTFAQQTTTVITETNSSPSKPPSYIQGQVYYGPDYTTGYSYTTVLGGWGKNDPYEGAPYNWGDTRVWVPSRTVVLPSHTEMVPGHWEYR